jgi:hypothetical protein
MKMYVPLVVGFCVLVFRFNSKIRIDEAIIKINITAIVIFLRRYDFLNGLYDLDGIADTGVPHDMQNLASGIISLLQFGQKGMAKH